MTPAEILSALSRVEALLEEAEKVGWCDNIALHSLNNARHILSGVKMLLAEEQPATQQPPIELAMQTIRTSATMFLTCPECGGWGNLKGNTANCKKCRGSGTIPFEVKS